MTEGRDGISLAPNRAPGLMGVARRLSVVAAMLAIAAFVAGTASSGYAGSGLTDPVTVSNFGGVFAGSLETFPAGAGHNAKPASRAKGGATLLSIGPYSDAVSSQGRIAVPLPFDFVGLSAQNPSVQAPINALFDFLHLKPPKIGCGTFGFPPTSPLFGTGLVGIFSPTATGNAAPESIICAPGFSIGGDGAGLVPGQFLNTSGVFIPQGVAFESTFDGVNPGHEILAVGNVFPEVFGPDSGAGGCAAAPFATLGTITEYDMQTLTPGLNNAKPFHNSPVSAINPLPATGIPPRSTCPSPPFPPNTGVCYTQNTTIGGCLSSLAGPRSLAFDSNGFLFVVNNAPPLTALLAAVPHFVTVYAPGASGDAFPVAFISLVSPTAPPPGNATSGTLKNPIGIAVATLGFEDDLIFVTDTDNSIKIFNVFVNPDGALGGADTGELMGTIQGPSTKLKNPKGVALSADGDTLYVVNSSANTLSMFTDIMTKTAGGDLAPTLTISGSQANLMQPNGAAVFPQFVKP
jgi:hypothetical protein